MSIKKVCYLFFFTRFPCGESSIHPPGTGLRKFAVARIYSVTPPARSWRRATRLPANAYSLLHPLREIVTHHPLSTFFTSRRQNELFFSPAARSWRRALRLPANAYSLTPQKSLSVNLLKKNSSFSPPARSWRGATRLPANAYSLLHSTAGYRTNFDIPYL